MVAANDDESFVSKTTNDPRAVEANGATGNAFISLRGAPPGHLGQRFWLAAGSLALMAFAAIIALSFLSAFTSNAAINRVKAYGIPVTVKVVECIGNIGGSGSNAAGFTCRGRYTVDGMKYVEVIGSKSTFSASGTDLQSVVDPSKHSTVLLASAVRTSTASALAYLAPALLTILFIVLAVSLRRVARRYRH